MDTILNHMLGVGMQIMAVALFLIVAMLLIFWGE